MDRSELYDFLCGIIDDYSEETNLCNIHENEEGLTVCNGDIVGCCEGCNHLGYYGCKVECLGCKLYACYSIQKKDPVFKDLSNALKIVAKKYNLVDMRTSKEGLFKGGVAESG